MLGTDEDGRMLFLNKDCCYTFSNANEIKKAVIC